MKLSVDFRGWVWAALLLLLAAYYTAEAADNGTTTAAPVVNGNGSSVVSPATPATKKNETTTAVLVPGPTNSSNATSPTPATTHTPITNHTTAATQAPPVVTNSTITTATTKATTKATPANATTSSAVTSSISATLQKKSAFDVGSFVGGIVLTLFLLASVYFGCRFYNSKRGVRYRTIFLATGESYSSLHYQFRVGISTISGIVSSTCSALWNSLNAEYIPQPTQELWMSTAAHFYEICDFPNCCGAVDGKHVRIVKPANTGSEHFNYKKYFSVVLMAIANASYKFLAVDIGAYGRSNDSQIFKTSIMGRNLYGDRFSFPPPSPLPQTSGPPLPFVILADEAFQLHTHLLKPYSSRGLTYEQKIFNYRLSRARRMVECAFGILTAKWRVLTTAINVKVDTVDDIIKACIVLHNYLLSNGVTPVEEELSDCNLQDYSNITFRSGREVLAIRDQFAAYFVTDAGRLEWQDRMI